MNNPIREEKLKPFNYLGRGISNPIGRINKCSLGSSFVLTASAWWGVGAFSSNLEVLEVKLKGWNKGVQNKHNNPYKS